MRISVNVTVPKGINVQQYVDALADAQRRRTGPDIQKMFESTVQGWKNKPTFRQKQTITGTRISMLVYAAGNNAKIYGLVNSGSPSHAIYPRKAKILRFQRGYRSSTKPHILSSRPYQRSGDFVTAQQVNHPGFEAREFDKKIADDYRPIFEQDMNDALKNL